MKWIVGWLAAGFALVGASGCTKPCDTLSERICERAGQTSQACIASQAQAERANDGEQRACRRVEQMTNTMSKNR